MALVDFQRSDSGIIKNPVKLDGATAVDYHKEY